MCARHLARLPLSLLLILSPSIGRNSVDVARLPRTPCVVRLAVRAKGCRFDIKQARHTLGVDLDAGRKLPAAHRTNDQENAPMRARFNLPLQP